MPSLTTHNTPALRFPGYTGVWEQRPQLRFKNKNGEDYPNWEKDILDNVGTFIKGAPLSKNDISEKGTPFILYGELYTTYNEITKHVVRRTKTDVADRYYSIAGDVVIPASGETPDEISTATCVMKDGVILAGDLLIYRTIDTIDGRMMSYIINHQINNDISRIAQGKSVVHIQAKELGQITFECPSLAEQQKIADFFSKLDDLLALHQRQTQKLTELKQGLLQKMFPREGESVPRLRFPGFTTHWKQQKLGDIGKTYTGLSGKSKTDFGHGKAHFVTYMNVYSHPVADINQVDSCEIDSKQHEVQYGDVFFTTSSETPDEVGMSSVWLGNTENTYLNSFCFGYRPDQQMDPYFMAYILRSPTLRDQFILLAQGISRYNISKNKAMDIKLSLPSLSEQQKIGSFFHHFDDLINLHERYVMILIHLKKGLLQKMFPQD